MFILLIMLVWIAIALIYLLQYQVVRDYQPAEYYDIKPYALRSEWKTYHWCIVNRYTIFKFPFFRRLQ